MNTRLLYDSPNIPNESPSIAPTTEGVNMCITEQAIQPHDTANAGLIKDLSNNSTKAQRARLLSHLQRHGSVTTTYAQEKLNIYDPPARKCELVHKYGFQIEMTKVDVVNAHGYMHRVGLYTLIEDNDVEVQS